MRRLAVWGALEGLRMPATVAHPKAVLAVEAGRKKLGLDGATAGAAILALTAGVSGAEAATFLGMPAAYAHACEQVGRAALLDAFLRLGQTISEVDILLGDLTPATVLAIYAMATATVRQQIEQWHEAAQALALAVTGEDLLAAGIPRGPAIGAGLRAARSAALDGKARGKASQLKIAVAAARKAP